MSNKYKLWKNNESCRAQEYNTAGQSGENVRP